MPYYCLLNNKVAIVVTNDPDAIPKTTKYTIRVDSNATYSIYHGNIDGQLMFTIINSWLIRCKFGYLEINLQQNNLTNKLIMLLKVLKDNNAIKSMQILDEITSHHEYLHSKFLKLVKSDMINTKLDE